MSPTFKTIWKLLESVSDWEHFGIFGDGFRHKTLDIHFYADCGGVAFHSHSGRVIYTSGFFAYILMDFRTRKFRKAIKNNYGEGIQPRKAVKP